jgi:glucose-1-phosphate thymidylyltransferase
VNRKGIILAGGAGTRLYPVTQVVCKQLLPIYDKSMIYYPLSTLMLAGIREVLVISTPEATPLFHGLLGDGRRLGMRIEYCVQAVPNGLTQAFVLGRKFVGKATVCLILGDNILCGSVLQQMLAEASRRLGATVFGYYVKDPQHYGVVEFDARQRAVSIEEKPVKPKSNYAVVGLYFYDNDHDAMAEASVFIKVVEARQGLNIACPEEIAWRMGFIDRGQFTRLAHDLRASSYGNYLAELLKAEA